MNPRVLVLFGNVPLLGQERANIGAMAALRDGGAVIRFLIRDYWTRDTIQPELRRLGLEFHTVPWFDALRHGVGLRVWWRNATGILGASLALLREIRRFQATHLHAGSLENLFNFLPALVLTGKPLVFRVGDVPPRHHVLWRLVWRYAVRRCAVFVCDSEFIRGRIIQLGVPRRKTRVIYAPPPRRAPTAVAPAPVAPDPSSFTFAYVGQITREKGVELLVEAALRLCRETPAVRLVLAGERGWNNPMAEALEAKVRAEGLEERIRFLGYVENVSGLLEVADVHVLPTLLPEAYGLVVVEAKAAARPSIVFPSGGTVELVTDGVDGRICAGTDLDALLDAMRYYLSRPARVLEQGAAARESMKRFGFEEFGAKWRDVYGSLEQVERHGDPHSHPNAR